MCVSPPNFFFFSFALALGGLSSFLSFFLSSPLGKELVAAGAGAGAGAGAAAAAL